VVSFLKANLNKYTNGELASKVEEKFGFSASRDAVRGAMKRAGLKRDQDTLKEVRSRAMSQAAPDQTGENNPNWKGGVSKSPYEMYRKEYNKNNPKKVRAHRKVRYAIKRGDLERQPCEVCGHEPTDAHHEDYSKPLEVRWLCRKHHMEVHGLA
jgi:hypothetical protein